MSLEAALALALAARMVAGNAAAIINLVAVSCYSLWLDRQPLAFLLFAVATVALVQIARERCVWVLTLLPAFSLVLLVFAYGSVVCSGGLILSSAIMLASLFYRGWSNKRLID